MLRLERADIAEIIRLFREASRDLTVNVAGYRLEEEDDLAKLTEDETTSVEIQGISPIVRFVLSRKSAYVYETDRSDDASRHLSADILDVVRHRIVARYEHLPLSVS
jgi:hypothetical protein